MLKERDVFRSDDFGTADLAIVLGGREPFLTHRITTGIDLITSSRVPTLLLTGDGRSRHGEETTEAQRMRDFAVEHGISPDVLILEDQSGDTVANACNCNELLKSNAALQNASSIAIISSAWHMLRSLMIFRHHIDDSVSLFCHPASDGYNADNWSSDCHGVQLVRKELGYIRKLLNSGYRMPNSVGITK